LLKVAELPRSTFYYQQNVLKRDDKYQQLKDTIRSVFEHHKGATAIDASRLRYASWGIRSIIKRCNA